MKFDILGLKDVSNEKMIRIIEELGCECTPTDFAILSGCFVQDFYYLNNIISLQNRTAPWYLKRESSVDEKAPAIDFTGNITYYDPNTRHIGIRPYFKFSEIAHHFLYYPKHRLFEINYGEYLQDATDIKLAKKLTLMKSNQLLKTTGKVYTVNSSSYINRENINLNQYAEYIYDNKKYANVKANLYGKYETLSTGLTINNGEYVWLTVDPVEYIVDPIADIALAKKIIVAGFKQNIEDYEKIFNYNNEENSDLKIFINKFLAREIIPQNDLKNDTKVYKKL